MKMKANEIKQQMDVILEELNDLFAHELNQKLKEANEFLSEVESKEEEHEKGIRHNDSYYLFRQTTASEDSLANYHYEKLKELKEESLKYKLMSAVIPLLLEDAIDIEQY